MCVSGWPAACNLFWCDFSILRIPYAKTGKSFVFLFKIRFFSTPRVLIRASRLFCHAMRRFQPACVRNCRSVDVFCFVCFGERHSSTLCFSVAASKVALCGTHHHHQDQARSCFGTTKEQKVGPTTSTWHRFHSNLRSVGNVAQEVLYGPSRPTMVRWAHRTIVRSPASLFCD